MFLLARLEGFVKRNEKESEQAGEKILLLIVFIAQSLMSCRKKLCHISGRQIFSPWPDIYQIEHRVVELAKVYSDTP